MKSRDIVEEEQKTEKGKTFGTVSTRTTESNREEDQAKHGATADHETTTLLELGKLMAKLDQIDRRLKFSEEDREVIKNYRAISEILEEQQIVQLKLPISSRDFRGLLGRSAIFPDCSEDNSSTGFETELSRS